MQQDKAVTRSEIMDSIVREIGLTRQDSGELLERVLELISDELTEGKTVKLARFGNFVVREKRARMGRNIATWMRIAKHRLPLHVQKIISGLLRSQIKVLRMA